jgi:hypothetical protein
MLSPFQDSEEQAEIRRTICCLLPEVNAVKNGGPADLLPEGSYRLVNGIQGTAQQAGGKYSFDFVFEAENSKS